MSTSIYNDPVPRGPAVETATTTTAGGSHVHHRISWGAIFGGVVLVVAVQLLLSLLGAGTGLGTVNVNAGTTPDASSLGIGAGAWWIITSIIALAFGGYASAWLAGIELRWDGMLHGLITWGLAFSRPRSAVSSEAAPPHSVSWRQLPAAASRMQRSQ